MENDERTQTTDPNAGDENEDRETQISTLVERIRAIQRTVEMFLHEIQHTKLRLRGLLEERGENWSDEHGYARLTNEGMQRSYDAEALDRLILSDPLRYGWLTDYRRERIIVEHVQIK